MSRKPLRYGQRFAGPRPMSFIQGMGTPKHKPGWKAPPSMEKRFRMSLQSARYRASQKPPTKIKLKWLEGDEACDG